MEQAAETAQYAIDQMNDAINEIANGASELGTTVEQFHELQAVADDAGVSMSDMRNAFDNTNNVMHEAVNANSDAANTLNARNPSAKDTSYAANTMHETPAPQFAFMKT